MFLGRSVRLTRTGEEAIYSPEAQTLREKKVSDLKNRVALINDLPHAVLLSIHQNSMPQHPAVHGAQVFSNPQEPAAGLAQSIQQALNLTVNNGNEKKMCIRDRCNMMDVAAGLSTMGLIPFCSTFAMFGAGRAYEQIRNSIAYPRFNVKICCSHAGVSVGEDGGSHQSIEDIGLMRMIPGMTVIVPADGNEARKATFALAQICLLYTSRCV